MLRFNWKEISLYKTQIGALLSGAVSKAHLTQSTAG